MHQDCVFRYRSFFNNSRSCFQPASYLLLSVLEAEIGTRSPLPNRGLKICVHTRIIFFETCFRNEKTRTNPKASQQHQRNGPKIWKNDFCEKNKFAIPFSCENLDSSALNIKISAQKSIKRMTWKQARTTHGISSLGANKNSQTKIPNSFQNL